MGELLQGPSCPRSRPVEALGFSHPQQLGGAVTRGRRAGWAASQASAGDWTVGSDGASQPAGREGPDDFPEALPEPSERLGPRKLSRGASGPPQWEGRPSLRPPHGGVRVWEAGKGLGLPGPGEGLSGPRHLLRLLLPPPGARAGASSL